MEAQGLRDKMFTVGMSAVLNCSGILWDLYTDPLAGLGIIPAYRSRARDEKVTTAF